MAQVPFTIPNTLFPNPGANGSYPAVTIKTLPNVGAGTITATINLATVSPNQDYTLLVFCDGGFSQSAWSSANSTHVVSRTCVEGETVTIMIQTLNGCDFTPTNTSGTNEYPAAVPPQGRSQTIVIG